MPPAQETKPDEKPQKKPPANDDEKNVFEK